MTCWCGLFPSWAGSRARRYSLGGQLESTLLDVLEALLEAAYGRDKQGPLKRANPGLKLARHWWRLRLALQVFAPKRYEHGARLMDTLGRQIGGWLRGAT